jgi:hypothetical protein
MIDFGFLPNDLIKAEAYRSSEMFEAGELQHPFENWLATSWWEGGMNGYHVSPNPIYPNEVLVLELYGISVPNVGDAVMIYDIVSIETQTLADGSHKTFLKPARTCIEETKATLQLRGSNSLDPVVTMLRLLADASVPVIPKPAPERLNKQRTRQGKFTIPQHTLVQTRDYVASFTGSQQAAKPVGKGGHHASPTAHWRRAHSRVLASGRVVTVRSTKVNWRDTEELHRLFYRKVTNAVEQKR